MKHEEDLLDGQEFYELMQQYRMAPLTMQPVVTAAFEEVKDYIRHQELAKDVLNMGPKPEEK